VLNGIASQQSSVMMIVLPEGLETANDVKSLATFSGLSSTPRWSTLIEEGILPMSESDPRTRIS
jgi:hypothetical protein